MARRRYSYQPVGMDAMDPKQFHPTPGAEVVFSDQSGTGSHRNGKYRYVEGADNGEFHGMVLASSLVPVTKRNPAGSPTAIETARASALINDRRAATP